MMIDDSFVEHFERSARSDPNRLYARFMGLPITIGDLHRQSSALAAYLCAQGVTPGDRIAVMMRNSPSTVATIMAIARVGAVWIPVNVQQFGEGLHYILEHSDPRLLIVDKSLVAAVEQCGADLGNFSLLVAGGIEAPGALEAILAGSTPFTSVEVASEDIFAIMFTSGTTGRPKGVLVSHRMMRLSAEGALILSKANDGDIMFVWEPLYHIGGAQVLIIPFLKQVSLALVDRFSASRFWGQTIEYGATHIHFLGGILELLLKQPPNAADRAHPVRIAWGGGCRAEIWRAFEQRFGVRIKECYGMTETSSFTTINEESVVGSVGYALPWFEVKVLDPQGEPVAKGERGEIVVRPHQPGCITKGYFRNPEATERALRNGMFHTGDVGSFDDEGRLAFHGRLADSLRCRGENVSAWEVEHVVNTHPDVEDSAIVGVHADIGEQDIKLFIQPKQGAMIDPATFSRWIADRLPPYQHPRYIALVPCFARTPSQRIMKHKLSKALDDCWDRLGNAPRRAN